MDVLQQFHPRLLCAFESAAQHNPDYQVHVIQLQGSSLRYIPEYMKSEIPNINFHVVDVQKLTSGTPVQEMWASGKVTQSKFALDYISDMLRYHCSFPCCVVFMDSLDFCFNIYIPYI